MENSHLQNGLCDAISAWLRVCAPASGFACLLFICSNTAESEDATKKCRDRNSCHRLSLIMTLKLIPLLLQGE